MSTAQRERRAAELAEQRVVRLQQISTAECERRAAVSAEQRAAWLQKMSTTQSERLAAESAKEREARLIHTSANQRQRTAVESSQLTRSSRDSEEPFKQRSVQLRTRKFHEHFDTLTMFQRDRQHNRGCRWYRYQKEAFACSSLLF